MKNNDLNNENLKSFNEKIQKLQQITNKKFNIPQSEMLLYGIDENYFETAEELLLYCKQKNLSLTSACILEYLRHFNGYSDVIKKTKLNGNFNLYIVLDAKHYDIDNYKRINNGFSFKNIHVNGEVKDIYDEFKYRGINFENDIYNKKIKEKKKMLQRW